MNASSLLTSNRRTAQHEAAHAAALLVSGQVPLCVRSDLPPPNSEGRMVPDLKRYPLSNPENARNLLTSVLAPAALEGFLPEFQWPIEPETWENFRSDAKAAQHLIDILNLDQVDYLGYVHRARRLTRNQRYCKLLLRITDLLEEHELLVQPELERIAKGID